ncbi:MAG TPA: sigma 54-interacting transcriptional regulator, partial [Blastocatellia bacterium]|nr:sigma 54-interacting transcriptional regulator [Blastocatellia bacterium]
MQSYATSSPQQLVDLIEDGQRAAEEFRHDEAVEKFELAVKSPLLNTEQRARVRCALAESLEYLARYRDALSVISEYETASIRAQLSVSSQFQVWLRLGSLQGYLGDHPRAISYVKSALALAEKSQEGEQLGVCHMVLGRIYRGIGEAQFARDHLRIALQHHRKIGQWIALAQNYFLLGNLYLNEGEMGAARENFEQAIKIIGERRAPLLLGSIYTSLSNLILLQEHRQATEGVETLEKAIYYLKEAKNDRLLAYAYSNFGFVLTNIGEWERAKQALQFAIEVGDRLENRAVQGTALDTLGELLMLQGNLPEAERILERSLYHLRAVNFTYGEVQAVQTQGRCYLAQGQYEKAAATFTQQLELAERIEDRRSQHSAQLYLAQTQVETGNLDAAQTLLDRVSEEIDGSANISLLGHFCAVNGRLQQQRGNYEEARHEFGQAITIFSMVADRYRETVARYHLGQTLAAAGQWAAARAEMRRARAAGERLAAPWEKIDDAIAWITAQEKAVASLPAVATASHPPTNDAMISNAVVLRLLRASSSRELLLQELVVLLAEMTQCAPIIVLEEQEGQLHPLTVRNGDWQDAENVRVQAEEQLRAATSDLGALLRAVQQGGGAYKLRVNQARLLLYLGRSAASSLPRTRLELLLRLVETGLELTEKNDHAQASADAETSNENAQITAEGFVFASPPMRALLADIHKIRSSRVTALITGESGTGKEVVARTIHNLSDRRDKPFVAFNCTIAAPEVVNSQLFGHKKGSFTGAVSDTTGVIQSAHGGTLFLDEIGDLALEVQPKLLRFLQDGEVHRLGDTVPTKVDVRVVAATNADLEAMVAEGKFREDLYYRLNIIRLHLPPLRERREEIPLLLEHFLKLYSQQSHKEGITISPHTMDLLMVYDWPGNVRQLTNEMQRLVAYKDSGDVITERDLSAQIYQHRKNQDLDSKDLTSVTAALLHTAAVAPPPVEVPPARLHDPVRVVPYQTNGRTLSEIVDEVETQVILDAMRRHQGHREIV